MKKFSLPALLLVVCFFSACSSAPDGGDLLEYQRVPMTVEATLSNEQGTAVLTLHITDSENLSVCYSEPAVMRGVSYELRQNKPYLCFGSTQVPMADAEVCIGSLALARFFLLDYSMLTDSSPDVEQGQNVTRQTFTGDQLHAVVILSQEGLPIKITGECGGFAAELTNIKISYGE